MQLIREVRNQGGSECFHQHDAHKDEHNDQIEAQGDHYQDANNRGTEDDSSYGSACYTASANRCSPDGSAK